MNEKPQLCLCMPAILTFLSKLALNYWSLRASTAVVVIEVSMVDALRLRTNLWWLHEAKYLPLTNMTYNHAGFYSIQAI